MSMKLLSSVCMDLVYVLFMPYEKSIFVCCGENVYVKLGFCSVVYLVVLPFSNIVHKID
jgi:hypothetical protein